MKKLEDGRTIIRVRIEGSLDGVKFTYEDPIGHEGSQYIWPKKEGEEDDNINSEYWWREGNMSCDCNRWGFLPSNLQRIHSGECGSSIRIYRLIPLEGDFPTVEIDVE